MPLLPANDRSSGQVSSTILGGLGGGASSQAPFIGAFQTRSEASHRPLCADISSWDGSIADVFSGVQLG